MEIPNATRKEGRKAEKAQESAMEKAFCARGMFFTPCQRQHASDEPTGQEENSVSPVNPAPWAITVILPCVCKWSLTTHWRYEFHFNVNFQLCVVLLFHLPV